MRTLLVLAARFCLTSWVGAAAFFVVTLMRLRYSPLFDEPTKLNHARALFPLYYTCEFSWLAAALGAAAASRVVPGVCPPISRLVVGLAAATLGIAVTDWLWVYQPLVEMIAQPMRPPDFAFYHAASTRLNAASLLLCATAAILAQWPAAQHIKNAH